MSFIGTLSMCKVKNHEGNNRKKISCFKSFIHRPSVSVSSVEKKVALRKCHEFQLTLRQFCSFAVSQYLERLFMENEI